MENESLEEFIQKQLDEGSYSSYEEIVADGLRLLQQQRQQEKKIADSISPAIDYFRNGNAGLKVDADEIKRLGRKFLVSQA